MRVALGLEYDGSRFLGWQTQPGGGTVQDAVERALSAIAACPTPVTCAGRTDRGVHAVGQVVAVDAPEKWTPGELRRALNALLSDDVWVSDARLAAAHFHPRYGALSRAYVYRIGLVAEARSPFHARWCWPLEEALDLQAMELAARLIPGDHSFRAFAKPLSLSRKAPSMKGTSSATDSAWP